MKTCKRHTWQFDNYFMTWTDRTGERRSARRELCAPCGLRTYWDQDTGARYSLAKAKELRARPPLIEKVSVEKFHGGVGLRFKGQPTVERFPDGIGICFG